MKPFSSFVHFVAGFLVLVGASLMITLFVSHMKATKTQSAAAGVVQLR